MKQQAVYFPADLAFALNMQNEEFAKEIQTLALVKLFELGKISSGKASKILNISRIDFFGVLAKYGVSIFNDISEETLTQDLENA